MGINKTSFEEQIKTNREEFRASATDALLKFTPDDRELAASLEATHTTADDVLRAWFEQLEPLYQDLDDKRTDARFKKYLIRNMGFHDEEADHVIDDMIDRRKQSLLDEVLGNLYPEDGEASYQRDYAADLLSKPQPDINDFFSRYIDFVQAIDASDTHGVLLCDPHAGWLERQKAAIAINKERSKIHQNEEARLEDIAVELHDLERDERSLLGHIITKKWDFITILDLRSKYQKQVDGLPAGDKKNPNKRLRLFERVTSSFRDREAERIAHATRAHTLKQLREINEDIYDLLLEIFDLGNADRNQLLLDIQKHTKLSQERDLILLIKRNREHFLSIHG